jgi:hypothetical protein
MAATTGSRVFTTEENDISWGNDPLNYLVRVFIAFTQTIWEAAPRGAFHWAPELQDTELVITEENPVHVDTMEKRPALVIALGPARFNGSTLDDLAGLNFHNAAEKHMDLVPTNITITCLSRVQAEARFLAWQNARMIWILRKLLIAEKGIQDCGRRNEIGPVTPAGTLVQGDTESEWCACAVTVPVFLQWSDFVTPLKYEANGHPIHTLEHLEMNFRAKTDALRASIGMGPSGNDSNMSRWSAHRGQEGLTVQTAGGPRPPTIRGRQIQVGTSVPVFQGSKVK